jgi:outer membrane protein
MGLMARRLLKSRTSTTSAETEGRVPGNGRALSAREPEMPRPEVTRLVEGLGVRGTQVECPEQGGVMRKGLLWLISLVAVLWLALPAQAFEFGVRGNYWFTDLKGDIRLDGSSLAGTKLDFHDDLGVGNESYPVGEVFLGLGNHHLFFSYYHADYSGTETLTETINFGDQTFAMGDRVESNLEYDVFDLTYQYDLVNLKRVPTRFSLGLLARVMVYDGKAEIQEKALNQSETETFTVPIPMVGLSLRLGLPVDILEARVRAAGMGYKDGYAVDGQAELALTFIPFVEIQGGYRIFRVNLDTNDLDLDYDTSGPYVGATIHF